MTWADISKRWWVYSELDKTKRIRIGTIKKMEANDTDYLCMMKSAHYGIEIVRNDTKGEVFQVYVPSSKTGQPLSRVWARFSHLEVSSENSCEKVWLFKASQLDEVAELAGIRKNAAFFYRNEIRALADVNKKRETESG